MKIFSIDPGNTTGYCIMTGEINRTAKEWKVTSIIKMGEFPYYVKRGRETVPNTDIQTLVLQARLCDVVVIEDFVVRQSFIGDRILAIRVIGAFEQWVNPESLVFQQPYEKRRVPDKKLREMELYTNSAHVNDALRHAVIYLIKNTPTKKFKYGDNNK